MKKVLSIVTLALFIGALSMPSMAQTPPKEKQKSEAADTTKKCTKSGDKKCCTAKSETSGCCKKSSK
jgi:hypothetical protein